MPANLENSAVATGLEKVSFHSNPKERQCQECSNYCAIALISHTSKVMLKILQATWTKNFQVFKLVLEKAEEPEIKLPISAESLKKRVRSRKISISASLTTPKPLTVWITINFGKFWNRWEYKTTLPDLPLRNLYAGQEATVSIVYEQRTRSKSGKEYVKAIYCHPAFLIYMQSTSC